MKKSLAILLLALLSSFATGAQNSPEAAADSLGIVERLNASGHIVVSQPAAMEQRLRRAEPAEREEAEKQVAPRGHVGYRIQVFDDNNPRTARGEAQNRKRLLESRFPQLRGYMQFNSPYWRVRMGDFRSQ